MDCLPIRRLTEKKRCVEGENKAPSAIDMMKRGERQQQGGGQYAEKYGA